MIFIKIKADYLIVLCQVYRITIYKKWQKPYKIKFVFGVYVHISSLRKKILQEIHFYKKPA